MIKKRKALFKSFNLSLFTSLVCLDAPAFADSIHSVSDLRFHLSILLGANQPAELLAAKFNDLKKQS